MTTPTSSREPDLERLDYYPIFQLLNSWTGAFILFFAALPDKKFNKYLRPNCKSNKKDGSDKKYLVESGGTPEGISTPPADVTSLAGSVATTVNENESDSSSSSGSGSDDDDEESSEDEDEGSSGKYTYFTMTFLPASPLGSPVNELDTIFLLLGLLPTNELLTSPTMKGMKF